MTQEKTYQPIDCDLYDYLEIACMRGYEVKLELRDGGSVRGVATTTVTAAEGEFLQLVVKSGAMNIRLDRLLTLQVVSEPRSFEQVSFAPKPP